MACVRSILISNRIKRGLLLILGVILLTTLLYASEIDDMIAEIPNSNTKKQEEIAQKLKKAGKDSWTPLFQAFSTAEAGALVKYGLVIERLGVEAIPDLEKIAAKYETNREVKKLAIGLLGLTKSEDAIPPLSRLAKGGDRKTYVYFALQAIPGQKAAKLFVDLYVENSTGGLDFEPLLLQTAVKNRYAETVPILISKLKDGYSFNPDPVKGKLRDLVQFLQRDEVAELFTNLKTLEEKKKLFEIMSVAVRDFSYSQKQEVKTRFSKKDLYSLLLSFDDQTFDAVKNTYGLELEREPDEIYLEIENLILKNGSSAKRQAQAILYLKPNVRTAKALLLALQKLKKDDAGSIISSSESRQLYAFLSKVNTQELRNILASKVHESILAIVAYCLFERKEPLSNSELALLARQFLLGDKTLPETEKTTNDLRTAIQSKLDSSDAREFVPLLGSTSKYFVSDPKYEDQVKNRIVLSAASLGDDEAKAVLLKHLATLVKKQPGTYSSIVTPNQIAAVLRSKYPKDAESIYLDIFAEKYGRESEAKLDALLSLVELGDSDSITKLEQFLNENFLYDRHFPRLFEFVKSIKASGKQIHQDLLLKIAVNAKEAETKNSYRVKNWISLAALITAIETPPASKEFKSAIDKAAASFQINPKTLKSFLAGENRTYFSGDRDEKEDEAQLTMLVDKGAKENEVLPLARSLASTGNAKGRAALLTLLRGNPSLIGDSDFRDFFDFPDEPVLVSAAKKRLTESPSPSFGSEKGDFVTYLALSGDAKSLKQILKGYDSYRFGERFVNPKNPTLSKQKLFEMILDDPTLLEEYKTRMWLPAFKWSDDETVRLAKVATTSEYKLAIIENFKEEKSPALLLEQKTALQALLNAKLTSANTGSRDLDLLKSHLSKQDLVWLESFFQERISQSKSIEEEGRLMDTFANLLGGFLSKEYLRTKLLKYEDLIVRRLEKWREADSAIKLSEHIQMAGIIQSKKAVPALIEIMRESGNSDFVSGNVFIALGEIKDPSAIDDMLEAAKKGRSDFRFFAGSIPRSYQSLAFAYPQIISKIEVNPGDAEFYSELLESIRTVLPPGDKQKLETLLREATANKKEIDPCKALCALRSKVSNWRKKDFQNPEFNGDWTSWNFAMATLSQSFLERSKGVCETPERTDGVLTDPNVSSCLPRNEEVEKFTEMASFMGRMFDIPSDATIVYGHQYNVLRLEFARDNKVQVNPDDLKGSKLKLNEYLNKFNKAYLGASGSLYNMYAIAAGLLASERPPPRTVQLLKDIYILIEKDPCRVPYSPYSIDQASLDRTTARGAAPRSVPFYLALYVHDPANREIYKKNLLKCFSGYVENIGGIAFGTEHNNTHLPEDGVAPYYYYSTMPYAGAAVQLMLEHGGLDETQKKKLLEDRDTLTKTLLGKLQEDGLFRPQGKTLYPSSTAYVNPLAGLALLPMIEQCEKKPVHSWGVLPQSIVDKATK